MKLLNWKYQVLVIISEQHRIQMAIQSSAMW